MSWFLAWTPFALGHGLNPFFTNYIDFPLGVNLASNTSVPLLGFLAAPVTLALGPGRVVQPPDAHRARGLRHLDVPCLATVGEVVARRLRGRAAVRVRVVHDIRGLRPPRPRVHGSSSAPALVPRRAVRDPEKVIDQGWRPARGAERRTAPHRPGDTGVLRHHGGARPRSSSRSPIAAKSSPVFAWRRPGSSRHALVSRRSPAIRSATSSQVRGASPGGIQPAGVIAAFHVDLLRPVLRASPQLVDSSGYLGVPLLIGLVALAVWWRKLGMLRFAVACACAAFVLSPRSASHRRRAHLSGLAPRGGLRARSGPRRPGAGQDHWHRDALSGGRPRGRPRPHEDLDPRALSNGSRVLGTSRRVSGAASRVPDAIGPGPGYPCPARLAGGGLCPAPGPVTRWSKSRMWPRHSSLRRSLARFRAAAWCSAFPYPRVRTTTSPWSGRQRTR